MHSRHFRCPVVEFRKGILLLAALGIAGALSACAATPAASAPAASAKSTAVVEAGMPDDPALAKLISLLKYGESNSASRPGKFEAVIALGALGDARAVPVLLEHFEHEESRHLRWQIARSLGWLRSPEAIPALENALHDPYVQLRFQAAHALKMITGRDYRFDRTGLTDPRNAAEAVRVPAMPGP